MRKISINEATTSKPIQVAADKGFRGNDIEILCAITSRVSARSVYNPSRVAGRNRCQRAAYRNRMDDRYRQGTVFYFKRIFDSGAARFMARLLISNKAIKSDFK